MVFLQNKKQIEGAFPFNFRSGSIGLSSAPYTVLNNTATNATLTITNTRCGWCMQAVKAGSITGVKFNALVVSEAGTITVRLEGIDAAGRPNGVVAGSVQVNVTAAGIYEVNFNTPVTVALGQYFAITFTLDSTGNIALSCTQTGAGGNSTAIGVYGAAWTGSTAINANFLLVYTDGYQVVHTNGCALSEDRYSFDSGTSPDEVGNILQLPFALHAVGILIAADWNIDGSLILYDDNSNTVRSINIDKDWYSTSNGQSQIMYFGSPIDLKKNQIVRIAYKPSSVQNPDTFVGKFLYANQLEKDAYVGSNIVASATSRVDGGTWTDDSASLASMSLYYDSVYS